MQLHVRLYHNGIRIAYGISVLRILSYKLTDYATDTMGNCIFCILISSFQELFYLYPYLQVSGKHTRVNDVIDICRLMMIKCEYARIHGCMGYRIIRSYTLYMYVTYAICTMAVHYKRNVRIMRIHRYGYELMDKAIVENYNKSAGNARTTVGC